MFIRILYEMTSEEVRRWSYECRSRDPHYRTPWHSLSCRVIAFPDNISKYPFQELLEQHTATGIAHVLEAHGSQDDS